MSILLNTPGSNIYISKKNSTFANALKDHVPNAIFLSVFQCGSRKTFIGSDGKTHQQEHRCQRRLCPFCASSRKRKMFNSFGHLVDRNLSYMFLTGVHKDVNVLTRNEVESLGRETRNLFRSQAMSWAPGGIRALEFGHNASAAKKWRLHFHALLPIKVPFSNARKAKESIKTYWENRNEGDLESPISGVPQINYRRLKYLGKGNNNQGIPQADLEELYLATNGKHLINRFGSWL